MTKISRDRSLVVVAVAAALVIAGCGDADQPSRRQAALEEAVAIGRLLLADEGAELCDHLTDSTRVKLTLFYAGSESADRCPVAMHRLVASIPGSESRLRRAIERLSPGDVTFEGGLAVVQGAHGFETLLEEVDGRWYMTLPPEPRMTSIR